MTPESLPVRLRQARGTMSLADAAERSGVPADRIRKYEEGERQPYGKTLRRLAEAYDVAVAELIGDDRGPKRPGRAQTSPPPQPERKRRRRRRPAAGTPARVVEVPVEAPAGEAVRVVIELVIRPNASLQPSVEARAAEVQAAPAVRSAAGSGPTPQPSAAQVESPSERPASGSQSTPQHWAREPRTRRRRPKVPANTSNGGDQQLRPPPDEALEGFRQAYREFRRERG